MDMPSYMDLLRQSVEAYSNGAITLMPVPDELRISQKALIALSYDMHEAISANEKARSDSIRRAERGCR